MATKTRPPESAFDLQENFAAAPSPLQADGTVLIHIIRPGIGLGRGRHYYSADMLRENAEKFTDWNVYVDHLSPEARQALGGLPRSIRDIGGWIEEAWWDESVPADGRHERGAVVGRLKPIREIRELLEEGAHSRLKFSIKAKATDVEPILYEGKQAWAVEGIRDDPRGSVDCVTEAGAGGRIVQAIQGLTEAQLREDEALVLQEGRVIEEAELSAGERDKLSDSDFAIPEQRAYPIHDESHARNALARVSQHGSDDEKRRVRAAVKKRYPSLDIQESANPIGPHAGEGGDSVKDLEEALRDPDSPVTRAVYELVEAKLDEKVEAARAEEREHVEQQIEEARAEERAKADRRITLRDMRDKAHELIEGAELPEKMRDKLRAEFDLMEADGEEQPTAKLDLHDQVDGDGNVTKSAIDRLTEAVQTEIAEARDLLAEVNPTRVEGQGPSGGEGDQPSRQLQEGKQDKPFWQEHLEEAGVQVDEAFDLGGESERTAA